MKKEELLKKKIERYIYKGQLLKSQEYAKLEKLFLSKARKSFSVASLLFNISNNDDFKKPLGLASDFEAFEWVIISSYYSMYTSALSALAKLGFKSKSHAATIDVLEYEYVHKGNLESKHIQKLSKTYDIAHELISKLVKSKNRRETAQYDATPAISRENAKASLEDADEFIAKIEEILE